MDVREMLNVLRPYFSSSSSPVAGGATTQVQFNLNGLLAGDAGLVWDNTNKLLGIGTTAPRGKLEVMGTGSVNIEAGSDQVKEAVIVGPNITASQANLSVQTNTTAAIDVGGTIGMGGRYDSASSSWAQYGRIKSAKENAINTNFASYMAFYTRVTGQPLVEQVRITSAGYFGIGTTAPTSKLQVTGLPVYANNAAAVAGGLTVGAFYRTGADPDPVCVVH